MKTLVILVSIMLVATIAFAENVASFSAPKTLTVTMSTQDVLMDGVPNSFDLPMFVKKLQSRIEDQFVSKGYDLSDNGHYKLNVRIESVAHKYFTFRFRTKFVIQYRAVLSQSDKTIVRYSSEAIDHDQAYLVNEISEDIYNGIAGKKESKNEKYLLQ